MKNPQKAGMDQVEKQRRLEADAIHEGVLRYRQLLRTEPPSRLRSGLDLIRSTLPPLVEAIKAEQEALCDSRRRPKLPRYGLPLLSVEPEKLALITVQAILDLVVISGAKESLPSVTHTALLIGQLCRRERWFDLQHGRARHLFGLLVSRNRNPWMARARAQTLARKLDSVDYWERGHREIHLGVALIRLAENHTGAFRRVEFWEGSGSRTKTRMALRLTETAERWLTEREAGYEVLAAPVYRPMVVEPRPWAGLRGGGYLTIRDIDFVKRMNRRLRAALKNSDLQQVFAAANALQGTRWRVNAAVLKVMCRLWERNDPRELRLFVPEGVLPEEPGEEFYADSPLEQKAVRAHGHRVRAKTLAAKALVRGRLEACNRLLSEECLYFPHQVDYRGRAYPIPQLLHPQSDDTGRALLKFSRGEPLGESGSDWLAIQLANTFDIGKVSFDERVRWVAEHELEIRDSARRSIDGERFWTRARKPWSFLAACFEWDERSSTGSRFRSYLPISLDGTCNGLQHLSAMGRDAEGGKATNLLPGSRPRDIYEEVATRVIARIEEDVRQGHPAALEWLGRITRDVVKPATMTTPYGVTLEGIRRQLRGRKFKKGTAYLARVLRNSIADVVVKATEIMTWLQSIARILAKVGRGIYWTAPTGFRVVQEHRQREKHRIVTEGLTLLVYEEDAKRRIDVKRQVSSIAPNFIHSLDAAHMMLTVNRLHRQGLREFSMVHDSYGVHACYVDQLNVTLREEFVRIYREPVMARFLAELRANTGVDLPAPPPQGTLDIEAVLRSDYFFS